MPGWILPALVALSIVATLAALAWLVSALRRMPARFASPFDLLPARPQPVVVPKGVRHAGRTLAAAMLVNSALMLAMAGR